MQHQQRLDFPSGQRQEWSSCVHPARRITASLQSTQCHSWRGTNTSFFVRHKLLKRRFYIVVVGAGVFVVFCKCIISNSFLALTAIDLEEWWMVRDSRTDRAKRAASWRTSCCPRLWLAETRPERDDYWPSGRLSGVELKIDEAVWQSFASFILALNSLPAASPSFRKLPARDKLFAQHNCRCSWGPPMPTSVTEVSDSWLVDYWIASSFDGSLAADANLLAAGISS